MASGDERGSSRLLVKLDDAMGSRKFYEAHQLMRTINFRYTSSKKLLELENLLVKTAGTLLDAEQYESGTDVAIMMTKLFLDNNLPANIDRIKKSITLVEKMTASPERQNFIANIVEWCGSAELAGNFHEAVTQIYMKENSYPEAWKHLIRMSNGKLMATLTVDLMKRTYIHKTEYDLTVSLLVLTLLVGRRTAVAEEANKELQRICSSEVTDSPLCFGVRFILEAVKADDVEIYKTIKKVYWPSFNRESNISRLVDAIGKIIFKVPDGSHGSRNGFMSSLMSAFMQPEASPTHQPKSSSSSASDQLALD